MTRPQQTAQAMRRFLSTKPPPPPQPQQRHRDTGMLLLKQGSSEFEASPGNFLLKTKSSSSPAFSAPQQFNVAALRNLLMPRSFETSTLKSYLPYVQYTMLSSTFGTAASVISMQSLLLAIGVGGGGGTASAAAATLPLAATINWILKDGLGQLGGILFANYLGTSFDSDPKRFRFAADLALALGVVLESCTALLPGSFLLIASVANVCKNVAWISASATRASIHQSFCLERNLADVTAKAGSQTTSASLAGTVLGISLSYALLSTPLQCVTACAALSSLHLTFSYAALQQVQMNNLNIQRAWLCLVPAMLPRRQRPQQSVLCSLDFDQLATPKDVSKWERILHFGKWGGRDGVANLVSPLAHITQMMQVADNKKQEAESNGSHDAGSWRWYLLPPKRFNSQLNVNPSVEHNLNPDDLRICLDQCNEFQDQHLILVRPVLTVGGAAAGGSEANNQFRVQLWFLAGADQTQVLHGFLHAALVAKALHRLEGVDFHPDSKYHATVRDVRVAMEMEKATPRFIEALQAKGWDVKHVFIEDHKEESRVVIAK